MIVFFMAIGLSILNNRNRLNVTRVIDGDTIELSDKRHIRLIGVDTPETDECFATDSAEFTRKMLTAKEVRVETDVNEIDNFGRTLGYVFLKNGSMINESLLEMGAGEYFNDTVNEKYKDRLITAAEKGKAQKLGKWDKCAPAQGCLIKGNLDKNDVRRYVAPDSRHYEQTIVNLRNGDRWFCSEEEAVKAGFEKARI
jgi:micrococcal nuclease